MNGEYAPKQIREKWQAYWEKEKTFRTPNPGEPGFDPARPKCYILDFFPYPSGAGLHVGHPEGYTATDILSRYRRMNGYAVLHTMGWDAFGLPAEQHALETGEHPAVATARNIANFRRQLKMLGFSFDWDREFATTDPEYYRWTQWIFLQIFNSWYDDAQGKARPISGLPVPGEVRASGPKAVREYVDSHRLAYLAEVPVNWCPALGTVLANEEVTNEGRSERGNHPVFKRPLKQWMLRITKYADRLARDLDDLDWPEAVKLMQRNWIGRSEGAQVRFDLPEAGESLEIFTTRPDTLFGATYMVLAPEHPLVGKITTPAQRPAVRAYCEAAVKRSDLARTAQTKDKTGVFTGAFAVNPVNNERIPVWIADYVLISYGTGAIMAVPAHDERDFEFAKQFNLPMIAVVKPPDSWIQHQIVTRGLDTAFAAAAGLAAQAERMTASAAPAAHALSTSTVQEPRTLRDGDTGWMQQVAQPTYAAHPALFHEAFIGEGTAMNSGAFNGLSTPEFKARIVEWLQARGRGRGTVNYKIRDWLFSRQRYWGEPFPILHGPDGEVAALDESELPLVLPEMTDFRPAAPEDGSEAVPEPPLGRAGEWATVLRGGVCWRRELNTMPQWAGSCWYYLRFLDPRNTRRFCSPEAERYWMVSRRRDGRPHAGGVDLYLGGAEHAVLHLLYARFWHKVLYDLGHVSTPEPFGRLFNQGMIRAFAYQDSRGAYVGYDEIDFREDGAYRRSDGERLRGAVEKMSKSLKNVINPEEVVETHGADALRLYEMFMGPLEASKPWNPRDVPGVYRFLQRTWRMVVDEKTGGLSAMVADAAGPPAGAHAELERALHRTIRKVSEDIERLAFNTAISAMMEFVNEAYRLKTLRRDQAERFVLILSPFAPHLGEELWQRLRGPEWRTSLACEAWPRWDPAMVEEAQVEIPVQVNGKLAGRIVVAKDCPAAAAESAALADPKVREKVAGGQVKKAIYVPGRLLNLVVARPGG
jgi:leucyl-tRNA synthetase